jgi:endoglucanase
MKRIRDTLLQELLSQPTAPFREKHIISKVIQELKSAGVPHFSDPIGNIIIGVSSQKEYLRVIRQTTPEPLRIFIAHMDHPGFHGVKWKSDFELEVKWHGGSPTQHLSGADVWVAHSEGYIGHGKLHKPELLPSGRALESAIIHLADLPPFTGKKRIDPKALYGGFSFRSPTWKEGELIYAQAADDLIGTFAITSLGIDLWKQKKRKSSPPFLGLLTRAEEVGFIGAIGHFELGWLKKAKRKILCVSLETSRTLPGAEIGKGPVVRLGDRFTVFDAGALQIFSQIAQATLPAQHQRRIMDGGSCEASAATVFGFPCVGISVPLGNYHNQSFEGGPDAAPSNGPAPEFVHNQDIEGLIELCHALLQPKLPWASPWENKLKEFKKNLRSYSPLLRSGP